MASPGPERTYALGVAAYPLVPTVRPAVVMYQEQLHAVVVGSRTVATSLVVVTGEADAVVVVIVVAVFIVVIFVVGDGFQQKASSSL
jgi:hypothetical protein